MAGKKRDNDEGLKEIEYGTGEHEKFLRGEAPMPENVRVVGPYGKAQVDVGTMRIVGGDDAGPGGPEAQGPGGNDRNAGGTRTGAGD